MTHAAELMTHAAPPARATPPLTHTHAPVDGGLWLLMTGFVSFALVLGVIFYLSAMSFMP